MYQHTSSPYPSTHDAYCRDCQRAISQGELIRRRVLDAGGVAFEEHLLCGEPSGDCTLNKGSINHMQEEMRRNRLDERVAELEAELDQLRASEETVRLLAEVSRRGIINDLAAWLEEQIRAIDMACTSAEMRESLEDALTTLRSDTEWIR